MARLTRFTFLCVALCCTTALAARELRQTSTGADGPNSNLASLLSAVPPSTFVTLAPFGPAPGPGVLAPEIAPIAGISASQAPAAAPVGGPGSCYVDFNADVQQQSGGSSTSYSGPACVIVTPGLSSSECQAQATASGKTYVPTADPACLYPTSGTCSSLKSTYPSATACPQATTTSIKNAAQQGKFNSAIASNQATAPSLFGSSIFGNSPPSSGSNIFGNSGGLTFPSFPGFSWIWMSTAISNNISASDSSSAAAFHCMQHDGALVGP